MSSRNTECIICLLMTLFIFVTSSNTIIIFERVLLEIRFGKIEFEGKGSCV